MATVMKYGRDEASEAARHRKRVAKELLEDCGFRDKSDVEMSLLAVWCTRNYMAETARGYARAVVVEDALRATDVIISGGRTIVEALRQEATDGPGPDTRTG